MKDVCGTCVYWRKVGVAEHIPPLSAICSRYLDSCCNKVAMKYDDFCSHHTQAKKCYKEPEHGDHTNLWASHGDLAAHVAELENSVKRLSDDSNKLWKWLKLGFKDLLANREKP